jgi:hypothetical protein
MRYGREVVEKLQKAQKLLNEAQSMAMIDEAPLANSISKLKHSTYRAIRETEARIWAS